MRQAAKVNKSVAGVKTDATLIKLSEAVAYRTQRFKVIHGVWHYEEKKTNFIAVSPGKHYKTRKPETRVFAANAQGEVLSWFSIIPAIEGHVDLERVLEELGFLFSSDVVTKASQKSAKRRTANGALEPTFGGIERLVSNSSYDRETV